MGNIQDDISFDYHRRIRYKSELAGWLGSGNFHFGLTLNFNRTTSLSGAKRQVGDLFARVDGQLLGTRFHNQRQRRTQGAFFFEHVETNLHCHGLVRVVKDRHDEFVAMFPASGTGGPWTDVCISGTHAIREGNIAAAANYITKEQSAWSDSTTSFWLDEFYPKH